MFDARPNIVRTRNFVKKEWIQIRIAGDIKADFVKLAESQGLTYSGLLHHMIVLAISKAKDETPSVFKRDEVKPTPSRRVSNEGKLSEERKKTRTKKPA